MNNWFESKVKFDKMMEDGMVKKVTELYLVDALSFTEAEARIIKEITPFISGEFSVSAIKRADYSEILSSIEGDRWYRCKVNFITRDEKSGSEKKIAYYILVQAETVELADEKIKDFMRSSVADYEIESIKETKILDIYPYEQ